MRAMMLGGLLTALVAANAAAADLDTLRGELFDTTAPAVQPSPFLIGARYWYSVGRHDYAFDASAVDPTLGNPTSELVYSNVPAHSLELYGRYADTETGFVVKGFFGGGFATGGSMNDRDWFAGQVLFSNTDSTVKNTNLRYLALDVGWGAEYLTFGRLQFLPFIGYGYWRDGVGVWGLTQLADDVGGAFYGTPAGTVLYGNGQKVGGYVASWNMARVGAEATLTIMPSLTLTVDAALIPYARVEGNDSHLLRQDELGYKPNVFLRGHGWGTQVDAMLRYAVTDSFSIGVGGRYWYMDASSGYKTDRTSAYFNGPKLPLTRMSSERYGLMAEGAYKF